MHTQRKDIAKALEKYLPEGFVPYVLDLMFSEYLSFKVTKPRKTKSGDYKAPRKGEPHRITVNGNLNPYAFLITTIHEFAHMKTYIKFGNNVKAHGKEWKNEFKQLLLPILDQQLLPKDIETALVLSLNNLKASSCTDIRLSRALKQYDLNQSDVVLLEDLHNNAYFRLGRKTFQRGILRRKRYLCKEIRTGKQYTISRLAEVEPLKNNDEER